MFRVLEEEPSPPLLGDIMMFEVMSRSSCMEFFPLIHYLVHGPQIPALLNIVYLII